MSLALVPRTPTEALLPHTYEAAKVALANCTAVDECQDWADKAAALASYARQRDDKSLLHYAQRIQGRAVRRCGELLKQFDGRGGDRSKSIAAPTSAPTQRQAAEAAGMSLHHQRTAGRVASISEEAFNAAIDSPEPPSVSKLADMGRRVLTAPKPAGFNEAIHTLGAMRRFVEKCREHKPELIAANVAPYELDEVRHMVSTLDAWLDRFIINLER